MAKHRLNHYDRKRPRIDRENTALGIIGVLLVAGFLALLMYSQYLYSTRLCLY